MRPRVLFRTHYQVDEPALVELLVDKCTSPVRSSYDESVAERLKREVNSRGKDFNEAAARYAVDLARGLGVINEQNVWSDKGHLVHLVAEIQNRPWETELGLTPPERLLHLRLFLEADGAALLFLVRYLLERGRVPDSEDDWNTLAKRLFVDIYSEYLKIAGTTADRVALRAETDRIRTRGYTGKSGPHKIFVHLQTLFRLGLIGRAASLQLRQYHLLGEYNKRELQTFVDEFSDVYKLEQIVKERRIMEVGARIFRIGDGLEHKKLSAEELLELIVPAYQVVMATGIPLCPITTVLEFIQIKTLIQRGELVRYQTSLDLLEQVRRKRVRELRFHVDRKGVPAFLKLSDSLIEAYMRDLGRPRGH